MKWFKRGIVSLLILFVLFFAFYKPKGVNIEGKWKTKEIVLDGKKIYPDTLADFVDFPPEIVIDGWTNTISIPIDRKNISANLEYTEKTKGHYKLRLSSSEKLLNGNYNLIVDTLDTGPQSYTVDVKLKSKKTLIHFYKQVVIPPWKPDFPKKGKV